MSTKWIPIALGVVILGLIGAGLYWVKSQGPAPGPASPALSASAPSSSDAKKDDTTNSETTNVKLEVDGAGLSTSTVVINTDRGEIRFKFYSEDAPTTTRRIVELIQAGFYNGLVFHRVVPGFVIQGGDPNGNGTGGSGQKLKAEFNSRKHVIGTVAMARASDPDSADSQFYISLGTHPHLDNSYTVFGQVVQGIDVAKKIQAGDRMNRVSIE